MLRPEPGADMKRREFIALVGGAVSAWPRAAGAQQMPVIGYLANATPAGFAHLSAAFRRGLGEMGYIDGQNVAIEYRWAEGQHDRLPGFVNDLVGRRVAGNIGNGGSGPAQGAKTEKQRNPLAFA